MMMILSLLFHTHLLQVLCIIILKCQTPFLLLLSFYMAKILLLHLKKKKVK